MTVRNDQPPLSRRELRDRSRSRPTEGTATPSGAEAADSPSADAADETARPAPTGKRRSAFEPRLEEDAELPADSREGSSASTVDDDTAEPESGGDGWRRPLPSDLAAPERTMTRRELRILRERAEAAGQPAPDVVLLPSGETTVTGMIPLVDVGETTPAGSPSTSDGDDPVEEQHSVPVAPDADAAGVITEEPVEVPSVSDQPVIPALIEPLPTSGIRFRTDAGRPEDIALPVTAPDQPESARVEQVIDDSELPRIDAETDSPPEIVVDAEPATGPVADQSPEPAAEPTLTPFDAMFRPPSTAEPLTPQAADSVDADIDTSALPLADEAEGVRSDILSAADPSGRAYGHWSTQAGDDLDGDPQTALSRDVGVGTGAVTTHALVLPSIPDAGDPLLSPLTSTGEIMVTGTIDLPRTYGSTGAHPALFDHPDVDAVLDDADREDAESAVAPVRAIRAVSSTTTTRAMIGSEEEKKSRWLPVVLIGAGVVVFVAAAAFVIAAFIFNPG